jgi:hypothetical protein
MKSLLLFLSVFLSVSLFGQSKKKQIESLEKRLDNLKMVLSDTKYNSTNEIKLLNIQVKKRKNYLEQLKLDKIQLEKINDTLHDHLQTLKYENSILNIPDDNFKAYLVKQYNNRRGVDINGDGEIQLIEASTFDGVIHCYGCNISDLTGIEAFTALTELRCTRNQITSLDVSNNTALTELDCSENQITSLDVSNNTALTELDCQQNQLTLLDVSNNTTLTELYCQQNQLTSLDVSNNTSLTKLYCGINRLTSLDVSNNVKLINFDCSNNDLSSLDISSNTNLEWLMCSANQLTSLDLSKNNALRFLHCKPNKISFLDLSKTAFQSGYLGKIKSQQGMKVWLE